MSENVVAELDPIFKPKSLALIGASNNPAKWGGMVLGRLLSSDFRGRIFPVNPKESRIFGLETYADVRDIPGLMGWADLAISAAGSTCFELAHLGLPALLIVTADNQVLNSQGIASRGAAVHLGTIGDLSPGALVETVERVLDDADLRDRMSDAGRRLVDGRGVERVAEALQQRLSDG